MGGKSGQRRRVVGATMRYLPVVGHPFLDQGLVERPLAAEHQIDAGCLVQEIGIGEVPAHLGFQPPDQSRQQRVAQRMPIDRIGRRAQLGGLREVEARQGASGRAAGGLLKVSRGIEQRQQAGQIGIVDGTERRCLGDVLVAGQRHRHPIDLALGSQSIEDEPARRPEDRQCNDGERSAPQHRASRPDAGRFAHQHRLALDDLGDQLSEEVAASLVRPRGGAAPLVEAEGAHQGSGQTVDRRPFLGSGSEIDATQHRGGVVLGAAERVDEKGLQRRFQDGDLRREGRDQGAAIDIRLLLQAPEQALVEAIDEKTELGRKPLPPLRARPCPAGR